MAKYVQITGFSAYPERKYSTRTISQIDPFLYLGHYVKFSYDFNYFQEMIKMFEKGGSFEQLEKHNEQPTVFSFNKKTFELSINSPINRRLSLTYKLNQEVVDEIIELIKEDVRNTMADDTFREALKAANAKERLTKFRNKLEKANQKATETIPESQKEEKVEEIKQEEEKPVESQKNDNNDTIVGQSVNQPTQEEETEEKTKMLYDINEAVDIILAREKLTKEDLNKMENTGKKFDIVSSLFPSQKKYFEKRYGFTGPSDMFEELKKYFS